MRHAFFVIFSACAATGHPTAPSTLGAPGTLDFTPGPLTVETIVSADWAVPLSGLLNLEKAGLDDREEPIQIFVHVIKHPTRGTFFVDTGVERDLRTIPGWLKGPLGAEKIKVKADTRSIADKYGPVAGVFLTHVHFDHVMGLPDLPNVPVYSGPGDSASRTVMNTFLRPLFDDYLAGSPATREWRYDGTGVIDVFGDGTLFALHTPGHTPGNTSYLARTLSGPVLLTGDACHSRYGWEHDIEPGTFSSDQPTSVTSLQRLRDLVKAHPEIEVRLGHQT